MPTLHFRLLTSPDASALEFSINHEGMFLFVWPFELALLWPGVKA